MGLPVKSLIAARFASAFALTAHAEDKKPLLVYVTGPIGVDNFLKQGWEGAQRAAKELGGTARLYESPDPTTKRQNVEAAALPAPIWS